MKKILLMLLVLIISFNLYPQSDCNPPIGLTSEVSQNDVKLTWIAPTYGTFAVLNEFYRKETSKEFDLSPIHRKTSISTQNRDYLDLQFTFPTHYNLGEAGVGCDGNYFYTTTWNDTMFYKYGIDGTYIETLYISGVEYSRNLVFCEIDGLMYASCLNNGLFAIDFNTMTIVDTIPLPSIGAGRATAYNPDLDVFYTNNWSTDVFTIDRVTEMVVDTMPLQGPHNSFYGFAYDNVSDGGPFLWGFSQNNNGCDLVQMTLPDLIETGVVLDITTILPSGTYHAGGLYIIPDIIDTTVTLGGIVQSEIIFGLELGSNPPPPPPVVAGYNVYRDDVQVNSVAVTDTFYYDLGLSAGSYNYYVTALYSDISGSIVCESANSDTAPANISDPDLIIGGNIFAGNVKLDQGVAHAYYNDDGNISIASSVETDNLGYYFFLEYAEKDYYVYTVPGANSLFADNFIPTYYGDVFHWENSPLIHLNQNMYNQDINLVEISQLPGVGNGSINGIVYNETKNYEELPANNVLMLLLNNDQECVSYAYTDNSGKYEFSNLDNGTYYLLCEIIGKQMAQNIYVIDGENQSYDNVNLVITSNQIVMGMEDDLPESIKYISEVFPNPVTNKAQININSISNDSFKLSVFNITGQAVYSNTTILETGLNTLNIDVSEFSKGIMFMRFEFQDKTSLTKKFIIY